MPPAAQPATARPQKGKTLAFLEADRMVEKTHVMSSTSMT